MTNTRKSIVATILFLLLFAQSCTVAPSPAPEISPSPFRPVPDTSTLTPSATPTQTPEPVNLYLSEYLPVEWQNRIHELPGISFMNNEASANLVFQPSQEPQKDSVVFTANRVYAVAVPFFTVNANISFTDLSAIWKGSSGSVIDQEILVSVTSEALLSEAWGKPGPNVVQVKPEEMLSLAEGSDGKIAILPFEEINPRWKILKIDGISPLDKPFNQEKYPLILYFNLVSRMNDSSQVEKISQEFSKIIPASNRDESKMTVLIMTGTTAITRGLAYKITLNGTDYPVVKVKDWFLSADLRHVSNEIPFVFDCPAPDPYATNLVFCSSPNNIQTLETIGVNVVELTGNHEDDYGPEYLLSTLQMYADRGWAVYAAGPDPQSAREPVLLENNGNKIAFIGCNPVGPNSVWAKEGHPGVAACDFGYLTQTISDLKSRGYVVITTFQHEELTKENNAPTVLLFSGKIREDFLTVANAGSDIVQGSQAHYPMGFEFVGNSLIHFGLGNFLFDQMWFPNKNEFIDRHIIYDGKYINTEVLTAVLMDWSQPTPMNDDERTQFLTEIYSASLERMK